MKESIVQHRLITKIKLAFPDIYVRKIAQNMYSHSGMLDVIGCLDGKLFAIEVKTLTGKLSKLQEEEARLIEKANGLVLTCHGERDIEHCISVLRATTL